MLVYELVRVIATLHVCTKFHKDRTIFATAIVLTDIYIYIDIYENERIVFLASGGPKTKSYDGPGLKSYHETYGNSLFS